MAAKHRPMNQLRQHFNNLGLEPDASLEEVRHVYRELVRIWHPDHFVDDAPLQLLAEERLKEINEAYHAVLEAIALREAAKRIAAPHPAPGTAHPEEPSAHGHAAPSSPPRHEPVDRRSRAGRPAPPTSAPMFYFWPNMLFLLLALVGVRLSWHRYGPLSLQGLGYLLEITAAPLLFAVVCNAWLACSRRLRYGYVVAVLLFGAVIAIDAFSHGKEAPYPPHSDSPGEGDAASNSGIQSGDAFESQVSSGLPMPERRAQKGPLAPIAPLVPIAPIAPLAPSAPIVPRAR